MTLRSSRRTGKRAAVVGSGPAGSPLRRSSIALGTRWWFTSARTESGSSNYGIPNMKLGKDVVQRRVDLMTAEGIEFMPASPSATASKLHRCPGTPQRL